MRSDAFFQSSQNIVKNFLSNVVAIDDRLSFQRRQKNQSIEIEDDFDVAEVGTELGFVDPPPADYKKSTAVKKQDHELDYQDLSLAFAAYGINCSGFIPDPLQFVTIENAATKIMESARRADITILDWDMDEGFTLEKGQPDVAPGKTTYTAYDRHEQDVTPATAVTELPVVSDTKAATAEPAAERAIIVTEIEKIVAKKGSLAKASIKKILQQDQNQHGRLRLIVIYTAEPDRETIAQEIFDDFLGEDISTKIDKFSITFEIPNLELCKIVVIEKKPSAEELREESIALFTELTIGLLSNAALSAIGELRDKTHNILHTFNAHLDPAYLSHVIGLLSSAQVREKSHEIAFDYAIDLISEEIKSNLQVSEKIKADLELERLMGWTDYKKDSVFEIKVGTVEPVGITPERLKDLLNYRSDDELFSILTADPAILKPKDALENFSKRKIQLNIKNNKNLPHESLSAIECKRRDLLSLKSGVSTPTIKQGSIVKENESFYICMQPLCDSVRLKYNTNFIFLKIESVGENKSFTHVLKNSDGEFLRFNIKPSSKDICIYEFKPDEATSTIKVKIEDKVNFVNYKNGDDFSGRLVWVGELKSNIAQALANQLAGHISRVGLDTNEWLRLSS